MGCNSSSPVVPLVEPIPKNGPGIKVLVNPSDAGKIIPINGTPKGKEISSTISNNTPPRINNVRTDSEKFLNETKRSKIFFKKFFFVSLIYN